MVDTRRVPGHLAGVAGVDKTLACVVRGGRPRDGAVGRDMEEAVGATPRGRVIRRLVPRVGRVTLRSYVRNPVRQVDDAEA